jgi:hypothetical protein
MLPKAEEQLDEEQWRLEGSPGGTEPGNHGLVIGRAVRPLGTWSRRQPQVSHLSMIGYQNETAVLMHEEEVMGATL